ncbi:MAG: hypothetical protein PHD21_06305 [Flavobacteriales bacterium]|nr:hypothetical protein [Flavobacteriales bacterium]
MTRWHTLTTESPNSKGFLILDQGVDWSLYLKNPVLLLEHSWGEEPIGRVVDIHQRKHGWVGRLEFLPEAEHLKCKYDKGTLSCVSVGGVVKKWSSAKKNGVRVAACFQVFEISLVLEPSNPDALPCSSVF